MASTDAKSATLATVTCRTCVADIGPMVQDPRVAISRVATLSRVQKKVKAATLVQMVGCRRDNQMSFG